MKKIVIALGGNALQDGNKDATAEAQLEIVRETVKHLADIIEDGNMVTITHGNGPQVGRIVIQNELASEVTPAMPFDVCGAMSQGMIGYHMQQALGDEMRKRGIKKPVATVVTQVVVDKEDSGRGYRRVVASPQPKRIVEIETVKTLIEKDNVVIAVGGGGIPVIEEEGMLKGVAAVIDKDLASQRLAEDIDADILIVLTAVEKVAINFGKPNQKNLDRVSTEEMKKYAEEGHFAPGSMLPKVLAAIRFVESRPGRKAIITSLEKAKDAIKGLSGTIIE